MPEFTAQTGPDSAQQPRPKWNRRGIESAKHPLNTSLTQDPFGDESPLQEDLTDLREVGSNESDMRCRYTFLVPTGQHFLRNDSPHRPAKKTLGEALLDLLSRIDGETELDESVVHKGRPHFERKGHTQGIRLVQRLGKSGKAEILPQGVVEMAVEGTLNVSSQPGVMELTCRNWSQAVSEIA